MIKFYINKNNKKRLIMKNIKVEENSKYKIIR
jgi:hypothetical protein